jgi:hypothetical protein
MVPVLSCDHEDIKNKDVPIAGSRHITQGTGTADTGTKFNLTAEVPAQAAKLSAGPTEAQCPEADGKVLLLHRTFNSLDNKLAYYGELVLRQGN